jgi:methylphosphotriester-DNA--protein-cysteine methyltransferase
MGMLSALLQELVFDSVPEGAVWPFDRSYIRPPHFHGQLECLLVKRGTAVLWLGPRAIKVRQGQLCWVLPGVPHVMDEFSADFDMWVIQLDPNLVASCWRDVTGRGDVASDSPFAGWSVPLGEMLAGRTIVETGEDGARPLCQLASSIWTATDRPQARRSLADLCRLALRVTRGNLDTRRELSVAELASCLLLSVPTTDRHAAAAEMGVSEGFLSRAMHRDLGVTFVEHRSRARVTHFLALVQQGESNLLAAALGAGFGSYAQFYRTFCRVSGSRPRDYFAVGRRQSSLIVAADRRRPTSSAVMALPEHRRQLAPL